MKILFFLSALFLLSCTSQPKTPDVSDIKIKLSAERFDKDFFSADTNKLNESLNMLHAKYGSFLQDYLYNILSAPQQPDSAELWIKRFRKDYQTVFEASQKQITDDKTISDELTYAFQLTKHYFPQYTLPSKLIFFLGPVEGYGTVLTTEGVGIGLQQYLGKDFPLYQTDYVREIYPAYQVRRFEKTYIPVNVMKAISEEIVPSQQKKMPLVEIMVEQGKRLEFLKHVLPNTNDTLLTGYTKEQLEGCYENEGLIWNFFLQNDLIYQSDPFIIRDYITDGPKTPALGEASPGNIAQFTGWQIVKKYRDRHEDVTLEQLMRLSPKEIFTESKYKPK